MEEGSSSSPGFPPLGSSPPSRFSGITNPLLPRSLGSRLAGSFGFGSAGSNKSESGAGSTWGFKSRFLPSHSKADTAIADNDKFGYERPRVSPSVASATAASSSLMTGARSSSGSASSSTNSSGYCTYSNENGLLRFTISNRSVPEDKAVVEENENNSAGNSMTLTLGEELDTVTEPTRIHNRPLTDLSGVQATKIRRAGSMEPKEPDKLTKTINEFMRRSDQRLKDWRSYERQRATSMVRDFDLGTTTRSSFVRAQSVARASSVAKDSYSTSAAGDFSTSTSSRFYPKRPFGVNRRNVRAASVARDDIFNEYHRLNTARRSLGLSERGASIAREDASHEVLSSRSTTAYNRLSLQIEDTSSRYSDRLRRTPLRSDTDMSDYYTMAPSRPLSSLSRSKWNRASLGESRYYARDYDDDDEDDDPRSTLSRSYAFNRRSLRGASMGREVDNDYSSSYLNNRGIRAQSMIPQGSRRLELASSGTPQRDYNGIGLDYSYYEDYQPLRRQQQQQFYHSNNVPSAGAGISNNNRPFSNQPLPRFLSLEEECNWILSGGKVGLPYNTYFNHTPNNDTLNDLLSRNASDDENNTLDDISGDEVDFDADISSRDSPFPFPPHPEIFFAISPAQ